MAFFGGEKTFDIQVLAQHPETGEAKTIDGQLVRIPWYRTLRTWYKTLPQIRLPRIQLPWLTRPPAIGTFKATTEDKREFKLSWSTKRATELKLDDEEVDREGEKLVRPTETTSYVLTASNKYGSSSQTVEVQPLPVPRAKASERIRVSLSQTQFQVQAGGVPLPATVQMENLGDIVDKFLVEVEGLDEAWYSRSASSIALMPQATDQVQISFQPPKRKGIKARIYPFAVTVRSQTNLEEATSVVGELEVLPSVEFKLGVRPYRISCRRKGTFRINLANTGVSDAHFTLDAVDLDEGLRFRFKNDSPTVLAWNTDEVLMIARPKRGSMVGEKKRYDITVTANVGEGNPQTVNCELNHNPFIGSWKPILRVIRAVIVLGIIFLAVIWVLHLGGGIPGVKAGHPPNWEIWVNNLIRKFTSGNILQNILRIGWPF